MYEKHDSYFPTIRCKDLFGAHIAMKLLWKKASDLIAYENCPQDAFLVLIIFPFPRKDCCRKQAFYTCVMKWFQPVCIFVGETNKDNYCQQIPFYPPCRLCLGRPGTLQPESIGLLGQSALTFYVFLYIPRSRVILQFLLHPGPRWWPWPAEQSCIFQPCIWEGRGVWERTETAAVGKRSPILMCANSPTPAD